MPTDTQKFSTGYQGGKAKVVPKAKPTVVTVSSTGHATATGPEAAPAKAEAESSIKRVTKVVQKTKTAEHTAAVAKSLKPGFASARQYQRERAADRRSSRTIRSELAGLSGRSLKPSTPTAPTATARDSGNKAGFTPTKAEALARPVTSDLNKFEAEGKLGKTVGQKIYQKVAEYGPLAIDVGATLPEVLEGAAVKAGGAQVGEDVVGGSRVAKALGAKPVEAASDVGNVTRIAARKADQQIAKDSAASGIRGAANKVTQRRAEKEAEQELVRTVTGAKGPKAALRGQAGPLATGGKGLAAQTTAVVRGHEQAIVQNPEKVAATTARALPGFITVPLGMAANAGLTAGRAASEAAHVAGVPGAAGYSGKEILEPVKYVGQSQLEFAKQVAKVLTSGDPDYVQKEVEDNLGLLLPISVGLGGKAIADHLSVGDGSAAEAIADKVRAKVEQVRAARGEGHGDDAKVFERSHQRKVESVQAAHSKRGIRSESHDRSAEIVEHARKMPEKDVLRQGATRSRVLKRQQDIVVRPADSVPFLLRNSIDLDHPKEALDEVKRIGRKIRSERKAHKLPERVDETGDLSTQDIIESLERHPEWLAKPELKDTLEAARHQEHFAVEHGMSPDHSEAARVSSVAVNNDIPQAHERFPQNIKHLVRADEKPGQDAREVLAKERVQDYAKAKKAEAMGDLETAQRWKDSARAKRAAAKQIKAGDEELTNATVEAVNEHIAKTKGLHNEGPEYVNTGKAKEFPSVAGSTGAAPGELSKSGLSKHKTGFNERVGHSAEGLGNYLESSIGAPVSKRHIFANTRRFLDDNKRNKAPVDSREARDIFDNEKDGINHKNFVLMDTQLTDRAYKYINKDPRFDEIPEDDEDFFKKLGKRSEWIADANETQSGRKYNIVPRAAAEEFLAQMSKARTLKLATGFNKWSNFLILNTSPAWALTQFGAEFAQAAISEPRLLNPAKLHAYLKAYHEMDPVKRREFEVWADATTRSIGSQKDIALALHTGKDATGASRAFSVMDRTKLGRFLRAIPTSLRSVDEWKGGRIRVLTALAKQDRDLNGHLNGFLKGAGNLYRTESEIAKELAGKSHKEVAEFWASHPKGAERYGKYLDEVMGNWSALTENERVASQMLIFYPFLRMSLKWTFYSFPKEHPVRAAMSDWLATNNSEELEKILGGKPGFFGEYANTPLYSGSGKTPAEAAGFVLPLSRLSVAGNAFTEALGGSLTEKNQGPPLAKVAESVAQPAIGAGLSLGFGLNKFTGKQEAHSAKQALEQAESLSPISRTVKSIFKSQGEQTALDELFEKLRGSLPEQTLRKDLFPELPESAPLQKDLTSLSAALTTMENSGSDAHDALKKKFREEGKSGTAAAVAETKLWNEYDEGKATLEKLYKKYGISQKAAKENKAYEGFEGERKDAPVEEETETSSSLPSLSSLGESSLPDLEHLGTTGLPKLSNIK